MAHLYYEGNSVVSIQKTQITMDHGEKNLLFNL